MQKRIKKFYEQYHLTINLAVFAICLSSFITIGVLPFFINDEPLQTTEDQPVIFTTESEKAAVKGSSVSILQLDKTDQTDQLEMGMKTDVVNGLKLYKIYNQPNLNSPVIYQAPTGTTFFVYEERAAWYMVKINTDEGELYGWVRKEEK